jgi:hypothetical protein
VYATCFALAVAEAVVLTLAAVAAVVTSLLAVITFPQERMLYL